MEVVREHFQDTGEDAYVMQYLLDESVLDEPRARQSDRQAARFLSTLSDDGFRPGTSARIL